MNDFALPDDDSREGRREDPGAQTNSEDPMTIDGASTKDEWRQVAQLMQEEIDPEKLMDLAQQLISEFDKHQSTASPIADAPTKSNGGVTSEAKEEGGLMYGKQHGTTRPTQQRVQCCSTGRTAVFGAE